MSLLFYQIFKKLLSKVGYFSKIENVQTLEFLFSNVANRPTVYKTGRKTLRWKVQQKGSHLRNYYVTSVNTKAKNFIGAKCESHGKVQFYWRPLGFCIFFYQSTPYYYATYPLTAKPHHKKGDFRKYKSSKLLSNAIIAYFDT